jgi:hypothetical protein
LLSALDRLFLLSALDRLFSLLTLDHLFLLCIICDCEKWKCDEKKCREFLQCCYEWKFVNKCK